MVKFSRTLFHTCKHKPELLIYFSLWTVQHSYSDGFLLFVLCLLSEAICSRHSDSFSLGLISTAIHPPLFQWSRGETTILLFAQPQSQPSPPPPWTCVCVSTDPGQQLQKRLGSFCFPKFLIWDIIAHFVGLVNPVLIQRPLRVLMLLSCEWWQLCPCAHMKEKENMSYLRLDLPIDTSDCTYKYLPATY